MSLTISLIGQLKSKQKIIFNSLWVITDKVVRMVGGLVVGIWVARYLGPYNFGAFNYATSIIAICGPLIGLGLNDIVLTDLIKRVDKGRVLFTSLVLKLCSGAIMCLAVYLFSFTLGNQDVTRVLLIVLSFQLIFQSSDIFDIFNQSRTESKNSVIAKTSAYIIVNIIKVIALLHGFSLVFYGMLTVLELVIASGVLVYFYFYLSNQNTRDWVFDAKLAKSLLLRSWPLIVSDLFISFYMRLDQLMLKHMAGYKELGRYSAALRLSEIHYFIASAICISIYPSIVKLKERSEEEFMNGFQKLFNMLVAISVSIALFFTFFSGYITHFLYGDKFPGVGIILAVHIWTGVFVFLGVGSSNWFIVNNLQRYVVIRTITGAVVNIGLNLILIPHYLSLGSAVATLIAQMFASVFANYFSKRTRPIFWLQVKSFLSLFKPSVKNYI
jgi:O-antigen/teichoic acid export membrane protein